METDGHGTGGWRMWVRALFSVLWPLMILTCGIVLAGRFGPTAIAIAAVPVFLRLLWGNWLWMREQWTESFSFRVQYQLQILACLLSMLIIAAQWLTPPRTSSPPPRSAAAAPDRPDR